MTTLNPERDAAREIEQTRRFAAPPALVFSAWTTPERIDAWWGPDGFRNETHAMAFAPGGRWRYTMFAPDGQVYANDIRYLEIVENERLVYDHGADLDAEGPHFRVWVTFEATEDGGTLLTMRSLFPTAEACEAVKAFGAVELGAQTLARLGAFVSTR